MIYPMYIDGNWYEGEGKKVDVISPINNELLGQVCVGTEAEVQKALEAAQRTKTIMENMTVFERAEILNEIADIIENNVEKLTELLCKEHGKPVFEARDEVKSTAISFREAAEQIKWMNSEIIPTRDKNKRAFAYRKPRGVFGVISPWNFPIGNPVSYYIAPGLAAGNTIVWVPALSTSAIASEFMKCIDQSSLPKGALNLVIGEGPVVGDALVVNELTDAIGFTGSTKTGETIISRAGAKPCLMELGGNGPTIVLEDADIEKTADALIVGSFRNAGQICTSTERVLVHNSVADKLIEALVNRIGDVKLGNPFDSETTMGPVHNINTVKTFKKHVNDAIEKGAKVVNDNSDKKWPTEMYLEPTILDYVPKEALINKEETFGPILPLVRFENESEMKELIEISPYRLSAAIFSEDIGKAMKFAETLKFGFVHINEAGNYWETQIPAGGTSGSASGFGRCGGKYSIEEMSELCTIILTMPGDE